MSKKQKRVITITAVTLLIAAVIVATVLTVVKINEKKRFAKAGYVTLEQLKKTKLPDKTYDNLDLSNAALNMPKFDDLYDIKWQLNNNYTEEECIEKCTKLSEDVYSMIEESGIDKSTIYMCDSSLNELTDGKPAYDKGRAEILYMDKTTLPQHFNYTMYGDATFDDNGSFFITFESPDEPPVMTSHTRKVINLDLGEQPDDKMYRTVDGEMSVQQAIELAQQHAETYAEYVGGEVRPSCVYVKQCALENDPVTGEVKDEDNGQMYSFTVYFDKIYKGVPILNRGILQFFSEDDTGEYIFRQPDMYIEIWQKDCFRSVVSLDGYPVEEAVKHEEDKFVSLKTACDKVSELYAPNMKLPVREVAFGYALQYKIGDDDGSIHQALPCWRISIKHTGEQTSGFIGAPDDNIVYVDAVTGDVYFKTEESAGYFKSEETDEYIK